MSGLKKQQIKKNSLKTSVTLADKHMYFVNGFHLDLNFTIPNLKAEREQLKQKLEQTVKESEKQLIEFGISSNMPQIMTMKDRIKEINHQIRKLRDDKDTYHLDNSGYIFEYFENKKENETVQLAKPAAAQTTMSAKSKAINNFFNDQSDVDDDTPAQIAPNYNEIKAVNIAHQYLRNVDDTFLEMEINNYRTQSDICQMCFKGELIPAEEDGVYVCKLCFKTVPFLTDNEKNPYKEPPKEVAFYTYHKGNHFKEIISQFQGKETTTIPDKVMNDIKHQIKKERLTNDELNYWKMRDILRNLKYNKLYEHINFIRGKLGIPPPVFSAKLEEILIDRFAKIQPSYAKYKPSSRINFIHYYYALYKFLEQLGEYSYLPQIPMLKDPVKILEQDGIFKKICKDFDWAFYPTNTDCLIVNHNDYYYYDSSTDDSSSDDSDND